MQFIDLKTQYKQLQEIINSRITTVLEHGQYIMGPEVAELEQALASFIGVKHCIGVANGSDALLLALMAIGVKPGDEVITTPFTFVANAEMICLLGATPVLIDIDANTYNIRADQIEAAISDKTRAIVPVNLYGQCADYEAINAIAKKHNIQVIEDAAQSLGAEHHGNRSGGLTDIGCTSFFPSKPLGGYGDGGACFTNDDSLAQALRELRIHGQSKRYTHTSIGINGRLDTLQAAIILAKLPVFEEEIKARNNSAMYYSELLSPYFKCQKILPHNLSVFAQYTLEVNDRETVIATLKSKGVPTAVHYPIPIHLQQAYIDKVKIATPLINAEYAAQRVMSLPMHPYLNREDIENVAKQLISIN